jgi:hypothetical protein
MFVRDTEIANGVTAPTGALVLETKRGSAPGEYPKLGYSEVAFSLPKEGRTFIITVPTGSLKKEVRWNVATEDLEDAYREHWRSWGFHTLKQNEYVFNIKVKNSKRSPKIEELLVSGEVDENEVEEAYQEEARRYLEDCAEELVGMLDWAEDWVQAGRSGGWLILRAEGNPCEWAEEARENFEAANESLRELDPTMDHKEWSDQMAEVKNKGDEYYEQWAAANERLTELLWVADWVEALVRGFESFTGEDDFWECFLEDRQPPEGRGGG